MKKPWLMRGRFSSPARRSFIILLRRTVMVGKLSKVLLGIVVLTLALVAPASAQSEDPRECRGIGQVTTTGSADFSVETRRDGSYTVVVDDQTTYEDRQGNPGSFADLQVGGWVAGSCERDADGQLHARRVVLLEGEPQRPDVRAAGEITDVNTGAGTFSLHSRQGQDLTFAVNGDTLFRSRDGSVTGLADLEPGMVAVVAAVRQEDGSLMALGVGGGIPEDRPDRTRSIGEITGVDAAAGTFTLHSLEGAGLSFFVSDRTRVRSRGDDIGGLEDLQVGMRAFVLAIQGEDGRLEAIAVAAGNPQDRPGNPGVDIRTVGRVTDVGASSFTLATRSGESLTISVDGSTIFRSRDGRVSGLGDLRSGMVAIVGAKDLGNGGLLAVRIGVGRAPAGEGSGASSR
jgi:hypothetical protein